MQKKREPIPLRRKWCEILRRTAWLWAFLCLTSVSMDVSAQAKRITYEAKDLPVNELLRALGKEYGKEFFFSDVQVDMTRRVSVSLREATLDEALRAVFPGKIVRYEEQEDYVMILEVRDSVQTKEVELIEVSGRVVDEKKQPLPGVTIIVENTSVGVASDIDGAFELNVARCDSLKLIFSFVGMKTKEIVWRGQNPLHVIMEMDMEEVDEVIVTGYFDKSKQSFSGAVTQVKREELRKFGNLNLISALSLVDPSFKIKENNERGSDPNTLPDFFIRGEGSFLGDSNLPTFIVDGYEVDKQYVFDMDIDRIESITILKDASATIFYGSRAANGVVVIETRRPEKGKFSVAYAGRFTLTAADLSDYDLMDAEEKFAFECLAGLYDGENAIKMEPIKQNLAKGVNTDWLAQPIRNAVSNSHSLYLSGGDDAVVYGVEGNYAKTNGVMKGSGRDRYGFSFDLTYRKQNKINIRNSFSFNNTKAKNSPYGSFSLYAKANPYNPIYDDDGDIIKNYLEYYGETQAESWLLNPLYDAQLPYLNTEEYQNITENLSIDYYFSNHLRLKGEFSFQKNIENKEEFVSPNHTSFSIVVNPNEKGRYTVENGEGFSYNLNVILTYNNTLGKHFFSVGAAMNLLANQSSSNRYEVQGFLNDKYTDIAFATQFSTDTKPYSTNQENRMIGILGNLNYLFDNRFFADFSVRSDGSSSYGSNSRWATLWSIGAGWNINRESFMENCGWIETLRLRASLGITGNDDFDPTIAQTMFQMESSEYYLSDLGTTFIQYGNKNLKWQKSYKRNIGIDMDIVKRRFSFRFDYYNDKTSGLLLPVTVAPSLGFTSYTENFGEAKNEGYEFSISGVIVRNRDVDWAISFTGTHNKNRILKISNALAALNEENNSDSEQFTRPISMYEEGESLSAIKAVQSLGINPQTGNELFLTKDGRITETWNYKDKVLCGDTQSKLQGALSTNFMWKNLSINILFSYGWGGQRYNTTLAERVEGADPRVNADRRVLEERWKKSGDHSFYKNIAQRTVSNATSRFVQDNDYIELSNLSISYRIVGGWVDRLGISSIRMGVNTNSLFYASTIKRERGLDYPYASEYTFSLNINF